MFFIFLNFTKTSSYSLLFLSDRVVHFQINFKKKQKIFFLFFHNKFELNSAFNTIVLLLL